jgi:hypothetical protein
LKKCMTCWTKFPIFLWVRGVVVGVVGVVSDSLRVVV